MDAVRVLVAWGAAVGAVRLKRPRFPLSSTAKRLRVVLDYTPRLTDEGRQQAKDKWRATVAQTSTAVAIVDSADPALADRALSDIQADLGLFSDNPDGMSVDAVQKTLTLPPHRDMRWHLKAHEVLLFACSMGVVASDTAAETGKRCIGWCERVYLPVLDVLTPFDRSRVAAMVREAENKGFIEDSGRFVVLEAMAGHAVRYVRGVQIHGRIDERRGGGGHLYP